MQLFKAMKKKYYLNFFFLSPFKMDNLLLYYCILTATVVAYSYTNYSLYMNLGKPENTKKIKNSSEAI